MKKIGLGKRISALLLSALMAVTIVPSSVTYADTYNTSNNTGGGIKIEYPTTETAEEVTYTVKHIFEGSKEEINETLTGVVGDQTAAVPQTVAGYTANAFEQQTIGTDTVVTINYTLDKYTITFDSQGGSEVVAITDATIESNIDLAAAQYIPTREGYTFKGWYTEPNTNSGSSLGSDILSLFNNKDNGTKVESISEVTANATYYAHWTKDYSANTNAASYINPAAVSESYTIPVGGTQSLSVSSSRGASYTWTSSNTSVATVSNSDNSATVTGVSTGTTTITCTKKSGRNTTTWAITVASVNISGDSSVGIGTTTQLSAAVEPSSAGTVTWASSDTSILTVNNGLVTGVAEGSATVTASITSNGTTISDTYTVNVTKPAIEGASTVAVNRTAQLSVKNTTATVTSWTSSNTSILTVDNTGKVTGVANGTATVTAYADDTELCSAQISVEPIGAVISGVSEITTGETKALTYTLTPAGTSADGLTASWLSSDTTVLAVDNNGNVTVAEGAVLTEDKTVKVTLTLTDTDGAAYTATKDVTVKAARMEITGDEDTVDWGNEITLGYTIYPEGTTVGSAAWETSSESILSLTENEDGSVTVTGNRQGTATVTARAYTEDGTFICMATKDITVTATTTQVQALVYILKDPTQDADSNSGDAWLTDSYGTVTVDISNAIWISSKNCKNNVDQRVITWPSNESINGTSVVEGSDAWDKIVANYKEYLEDTLDISGLTDEMVTSITLYPAKISRNNGGTESSLGYYHLDCNVDIETTLAATIKYYIYDVSDTGFNTYVGAHTCKIGEETNVTMVNSEGASYSEDDYPATKTEGGITYTLSGWYEDKELTKPVTLPAAVTGSKTYYAKYIAGYAVTYKLDGGSFDDETTPLTETHKVGSTVIVHDAPTKAGYKFDGWTVIGLDQTTIKSGAAFTMPSQNVTLTAKWVEKKNIANVATLTTQNVEKTYNGTPLATGTATAAAKEGCESEVGTLVVEYQIPGTGKWTTNPNDITATHVSDASTTNPITVNVHVTSEDLVGELTGTQTIIIKPATLTVTTKDASKVYDGTELTKDGSISGFVVVDGVAETATFTTTGTQTDVGSSSNTYKITWNRTAAESDYTVSDTVGKLEVTAQTIVPPTDPEEEDPEYKGVEIDSPADVTYDGEEHKFVPEVTDKDGNPLVAGTDYEVSYTTEKNNYTDVQTITVIITGKGNYKGEVTKTYKIEPRKIKITAGSASKTYDGTALTCDTWTLEGISFPEQPLASGEDDDVTISGTITYVGSVDNVITAVKISKADGSDSTSNYEITQVNGKLTVTKKANEIQIIAANDSKEYDGTALTNAGYTYTENVLVEGDVLTATVEGSQTNAGESANTVTSYKVMRGEMDVTDQYTFADSVAGKLEVTPKAVTIKTESAEKVYDGEELTAEGTITGILEGEREQVTFTVTGSRTEVGESDNTYTLEWGTVRADNYTVSEEIGKLTVTAQTIVPPTDPEEEDPEYKGVEIDSPADVTYDGEEHKFVPEVTDKDGNPLVAGTDYEVSYTTEKNNYTDVQTITVIITGKGNYKGEVTKTYKIEPRKIKITAGSASKTYDGTALTKNSYEVTSGSVATTDEITSVTVTGSITEVGTKDNVPSAAVIKRGEVEATGNYDITYKNGTLEITAQKINPGPDPENPDPEYKGVEINDPDDVTYDGEEHKFVPEVTDKDGNPLVEGKDYTVTYDTDNFTDVTKVTVTIIGKDNYDGQVIKTYEIKPAKVTITTDSASKVFDGTALTADGRIEGLVSGEEVTFAVTGSQTAAGSSDNTYTLAWDKTAKEGNYVIDKVDLGTLTVTAQSINPDDPNYPGDDKGVKINEPTDVTYDGDEHKFVPVITDKDGNPLEEGKDYIVTYDKDDFTNVTGQIKVTITGTGDYDGTVVITYQITPKALTVTTDSASKVYDGTALTAGGRIEGLVDGEEVTFKATGSQTSVGSSANTYSLVWDKTAKEGNYTIDKVDLGTLTVTQAPEPEPETPSQDGGNTNTRDHTAPRTGDDTMNTVLFLLLIMILAGAGFGTAAYAYKKRK